MNFPVSVCHAVINTDPSAFDEDQAVLKARVDSMAAENGGEFITSDQAVQAFGEGFIPELERVTRMTLNPSTPVRKLPYLKDTPSGLKGNG